MSSDPFALLGVPRRFDLDLTALAQRHRELSRTLHPDRFLQAAPAERRIAIERAGAVNEAFRALRDPQSRAASLLSLAGKPVDEHARAPGALLAEIMDLREQLDESRGNLQAIEKLQEAVVSRVRAHEQTLGEIFASDAPDAVDLDRAYETTVQLRYLYRFLSEADAMLDPDDRG